MAVEVGWVKKEHAHLEGESFNPEEPEQTKPHQRQDHQLEAGRGQGQAEVAAQVGKLRLAPMEKSASGRVTWLINLSWI